MGYRKTLSGQNFNNIMMLGRWEKVGEKVGEVGEIATALDRVYPGSIGRRGKRQTTDVMSH